MLDATPNATKNLTLYFSVRKGKKDKGSHQIYLKYLFMDNITQLKLEVVLRKPSPSQILFVHIRIFAIEY